VWLGGDGRGGGEGGEWAAAGVSAGEQGGQRHAAASILPCPASRVPPHHCPAQPSPTSRCTCLMACPPYTRHQHPSPSTASRHSLDSPWRTSISSLRRSLGKNMRGTCTNNTRGWRVCQVTVGNSRRAWPQSPEMVHTGGRASGWGVCHKAGGEETPSLCDPTCLPFPLPPGHITNSPLPPPCCPSPFPPPPAAPAASARR
jgi:hypothetical protein